MRVPSPSAKSAPRAPRSASEASVERILGPDPGPFALLWRPAVHGRDTVELLTGPVRELRELSELSWHRAGTPRSRAVLALLPFRQIAERGFDCHDGKEPVLAMLVDERADTSAQGLLPLLERLPLREAEAAFDLDDAAYAACVRRVVDEEIAAGAGANFVIRRTLSAKLPDYSHLTALAMFGRLLRQEAGAYWTFVIHTGERTFVGATPERHVCLNGGRAVMNPISGTYRHPPSGAELEGLVSFLADRKETDELSMVVDEELKMMAGVCGRGARLRGPYLKMMARLSHTEYLLEGESDRDPVDILRATMFAPTVTGSPLENACRVITRHERDSRGYYSGVAALIETDHRQRPVLDSSILIRTADIDSGGTLRLSVGATLVRHSDPASEAAETRAKAAGLLDATGLRLAGETDQPSPEGRKAGAAVAEEPSPHPRPRPTHALLAGHPRIREALARRNAPLAGFWLEDPPKDTPQADRPEPSQPLLGLDTLVVDAEDTFTGMLAIQLRALGARTTVLPYDQAAGRPARSRPDLVVVGPGPGDPRDDEDPRIRTVLGTVARLLEGPTAFVAVCLGHQLLARRLGFEVVPRAVPNQGLQKKIDFFGREEPVGFYNSFTAHASSSRVSCPGVAGEVLVSRDPEAGDIHGLRGPGFSSAQFHPESVLTSNGIDLVADLATSALAGRPAAGLTTSDARRSA
ncbi:MULTISPECIES: anthranilate synthase family protein [unclassified Streptomyces]|uniref:anthranilate synthase family protein n=1 Tax=unclassified Streptomyces TaxID=2593676 RepID=UPI002DDB7AB5|nr:anthranilate synthase family protein [Streptomyces sp. NBC_01795]